MKKNHTACIYCYQPTVSYYYSTPTQQHITGKRDLSPFVLAFIHMVIHLTFVSKLPFIYPSIHSFVRVFISSGMLNRPSTHRPTLRTHIDSSTDRPSDRPNINTPTDSLTHLCLIDHTDRPTHLLAHTLTDRPTYQSTNGLTDRPSDRITDQPANQTTDQPTHQPTTY
mgnify:CR=1 FL=1